MSADTPAARIPCPFVVGQRIHEVCYPPYYQPVDPTIGGLTSTYRVMIDPEIDPTKPDAIVTALTERGFTYEYLSPVPFGRAAWGQMMTGGECFPNGYHLWVAVL